MHRLHELEVNVQHSSGATAEIVGRIQTQSHSSLNAHTMHVNCLPTFPSWSKVSNTSMRSQDRHDRLRVFVCVHVSFNERASNWPQKHVWKYRKKRDDGIPKKGARTEILIFLIRSIWDWNFRNTALNRSNGPNYTIGSPKKIIWKHLPIKTKQPTINIIVNVQLIEMRRRRKNDAAEKWFIEWYTDRQF